MQLRATRLTAIASAVKRAFNIRSLFASGAPGVWYDPSDFTTLFQDSAGTTPVTAVEQPVGLMLDKSQGLVLGPELVTNGDFSNGTTGWTASGSSIAVVGGEFEVTVTAGGWLAFQNFTTVVGTTYKLTATMRAAATNSVAQSCRLTLDSPSVQSIVSANGVQTNVSFYFTATTTSTRVNLGVASGGAVGAVGDKAYFDIVVCKELPGNHAFQSTAASRPVLSARYNLLTKTEQFDDAAWVKSGTTVTANFGIAPDGTATADRALTVATGNALKATYQSFSAEAGTYKFNLYVKDNVSSSRVFEVFFANTSLSATTGTSYNFDTDSLTNLSNAAPFTLVSSSRTSFGNGWYLISVTVAVASAQTVRLYFSAPYAGTQSGDYLVWGADLRVANNGITQPAYQRVNTATDYATTGFLPYLKFDGVDDSLSTNSISFTATDKMSVFAGVRKLSDADTGTLVDFNGFAATQAFMMRAPSGIGGNNYVWYSGGSVAFSGATASPYVAPITNTLTGLGSISTDLQTLRVNGVQVATSTTDQGTGNYGNFPLNIGRRGGTSLPFNGQMYSMIIVGKAVTAGELSSTEKFVASKTGVTL